MRTHAVASRARHRPAGGRAHERQADQVAARFLRGETQLSRYITPAPTAGFALASSPGLPLAAGLRSELEQAFGADLGAVRLHTDVNAAAAARAHGAYAFASGAHIYLGSGSHQIESPSGRMLIAHEVAHALQQTARAGAGGLVRAVDLQGAGDVQRWQSPIDETAAWPDMPALLDAHLAALDAQAPERAAIERLKRDSLLAQAAGTHSAFLDERMLHVNNDSVDRLLGGKPSELPPAVASALYDFLKRSYVSGASAQLLHMRRDLKTRFFDAATYETYMVHYGGPDMAVAKARFYEHWFTAPWFGRGNPRFMLDRTLMLLLGPSTVKPSKQEVANGQALTDAYQAELKRVDSAELLPDELYFVTVRLARDLEVLRLELFEILLQQITRFPNYHESMRARIKQALAQQLRGAIRRHKGERAEFLARTEGANRYAISREAYLLWFDDVLPALEGMAEYAVSYWESVAGFAESLFEGKAIPGTKQTATQALQELDKHIPGYRAMLESFLHALVDREPDGTLAAPAAYAARRDAAVKRLDDGMRRIVDRPLADRLIDALPDAGKAGFSFDRAVADKRLPLATRALIAWAQTLAIEFREMAVGYSATEDEKLGRRAGGSAGAGDLRLVLRVRLARRIFNVGERAGWSPWVEWARPILQATEPVGGKAMEQDYLAFGTDWKLDPDAATGAMLKDLPNEVEGFEPLTTRDMVEFYQAVDYARFSHHIDRQLQLRDRKYELKDVPVLNQAFADARAERHPERYLVRDWEYVRPWEEKGGKTRFKPRQQFRLLLSEHPLTKALKAELKARFGEEPAQAVNATVVEGKEALVFWHAPTPVALIERVQAIPGVNLTLLVALKGLVAGPKVEPERLAEIEKLRADIESGSVYRDAGTARAPAPVPLRDFTVPLLQALQPMAWWTLWRAVLAGYSGAARRHLLKTMRAGVEKAGLPDLLVQERKQAFEQVRLDERRAVAHQRRTIVEKQLRPTLSNFSPYSEDYYRVPGGKRRMERQLAGETVDLLRRFLIQIDDQDERDGHQALAVLELSDVIQDKLGGLRRLDEFYAWGPLIDQVLLWTNHAEKGANTALRDSFTLPHERGNAALFDERRARLLAVLTYIAAEFRRHFEKWGLVAYAGDGTIENPGSVRALGESDRMGRGTVFANEGHTYEVVEVHKAFTFHPGAVPFESLPPTDTGASRLKIEGQDKALPYKQQPDELLMHVIVDGEPDAIEIRANDAYSFRLLEKITWALHMHAILAQLSALAAAMETFAELVVDLAELFPVVGQAVAAARLVTTAWLFIDKDLPAMVSDLITNPRKWLAEAWQRLEHMLSAETLIDYLLFSNHSLNGLIHEPRKEGKTKAGGGSSRRMKRLLHKLQNFGRGIGRVVARMQDGVQDRRLQVERYVLGAPGVIPVIQMLADYYFLIANIAESMDADSIESFKSGASGFAGNVNDLVASLGHMELPQEILPLEELINILIDVVGHRLGGKYKLGVKILLQLLDAVGARDEIVGGIASVLRHAGLTTKTVFPQWEKDFVPKIGEYLHGAQTGLSNTLNETFGALHKFGIDLKLDPPKADVQLAGNDFPEAPADLPAGAPEAPEAQPFLDEAVRGALGRRSGTGLNPAHASELLRALPTESGEPLPAGARARAEQRFGEDFSHVRLHRGGRAASVAQNLGARALTSGSHILMGPGGGANDSRLLYHELAHVIQQTGRRPAGGKPASRPRPGRPGRGVRFDSRAEAGAEAAAAAAMRGNARGVSLGGTAEGVQPSMIEKFGQRFLRQVADIGPIEAEVEEIDKTNALTGRRLIGKDVRKAVSGVADNLSGVFKSVKTALHTDMTGPYSDKLDAVSSHLLSFLPEIKNAIADIAIRASYQAAKASGGKPARMALDVDDFKRRLERYIFGKTGILLKLKADTRKSGRDKEFKNLNAPFSDAEVTFVFLATIHGNTRLWRDALVWRTYSNQPATKIKADDQPGLRTLIRAVLRDLGPSSSVWQKGKDYRLSYKVFEAAAEFERLVQTGAMTGTLPPNSLPSVKEYINTTAKPADSALGNLRLHLGNYDQKKSGEQKGKERESHHITQYLLVEYFHNGSSNAGMETDSERMAFPLLRKYRGRNPYGDRMDQKSGRPQSFGAVQIASLEAGRGGKMPTILLARGTHRHGNLHISPRADDIDDTTTASQAGAVNGMYKNALPKEQRRTEREVANSKTDDYEEWEDYVKQHRDFDQAISKAMQATYRQVRTHMQRQLKEGLMSVERDYYNALSAGTSPHGKKPMSRKDMAGVAEKAVTHNRDGDAARGIPGMKDFGWTA